VEAVADELDKRYRAIPFVAVGCGLRPEELFGLERRDVDRQESVLHIRRRFTGGVLKEGGKTDGSVRAVPLRKVVLDALDVMPPRIDSPCCSRPRAAAISTWRSSDTANGHPHYARVGFLIGACTTAGTHSPPGRSTAAYSSGISPG
jgi:integrase